MAGNPMNPHDALVFVFGGVFALLLLASAVATLLKLRLTPGSSNATISNLTARIKAWWVMIGALALAFWIGRLGIIVLFAFVSLQCLREFVALTATREGNRQPSAWGYFLFLPLQYYFVATDGYSLFAILIPVTALLEGIMIKAGAMIGLLVLLLMFVPTLASVIARLTLREGFSDVSFRVGGRRGVEGMLLALLQPIIVGLLAYGVADDDSDMHFHGFAIPPKEDLFPHLRGEGAAFRRAGAQVYQVSTASQV